MIRLLLALFPLLPLFVIGCGTDAPKSEKATMLPQAVTIPGGQAFVSRDSKISDSWSDGEKEGGFKATLHDGANAHFIIKRFVQKEQESPESLLKKVKDNHQSANLKELGEVATTAIRLAAKSGENHILPSFVTSQTSTTNKAGESIEVSYAFGWHAEKGYAAEAVVVRRKDARDNGVNALDLIESVQVKNLEKGK